MRIANIMYSSVVVLSVLLIVGWVMNIAQLLKVDSPLSEWGVELVLKVVGVILVPLGGLLGWIY